MREEQLVAYLQHKMPRAEGISVSNLTHIPGGASRETWSFDARWREGERDEARSLVIRRDPGASVLETERYVEFRVYQAVQGKDIPVPEVYWLETDPSWLERPFFVMCRVEGETSPQVLTSGQYAALAPKIARQKAEILGRIHNLDWHSLGLDFLGVPTSPAQCADMEIEKWESTMRRDSLEPQPVLEYALSWLKRHKPATRRICLVHADYRTGNFLVDQEGTITGVLDWEMVHLGDPMEDVAWACLRAWRWARDGRVGGLVDRDEWYRLYEEASGITIDPEAVRFWEVLGNVKLAVIFLTGARSYCEGRTGEILLAVTSYINPEIEAELLDLIDG
jgi:aminoglycoside phosphotransferase (APT) family kinase protein